MIEDRRYGPAPHPRDVWGNFIYFRNNGADPTTAMEHAQHRHELWNRDRGHFLDKLTLLGVIIMAVAGLWLKSCGG